MWVYLVWVDYRLQFALRASPVSKTIVSASNGGLITNNINMLHDYPQVNKAGAIIKMLSA